MYTMERRDVQFELKASLCLGDCRTNDDMATCARSTHGCTRTLLSDLKFDVADLRKKAVNVLIADES